MKVLIRSLLLGFLLVSWGFAATVSQTDWINPDYPGPMADWRCMFWRTDYHVTYRDGAISLSVIQHSVQRNIEGIHTICSTDIDRDGDADILGAAHRSDQIAWWENVDGTGRKWKKHLIDSYSAAYTVLASNMDNDTDTDVIAASYCDNSIILWENGDGTGETWIEHSIDDDFVGAYSVFSDDIDGDGDADILGAAPHSDQIAWWENDGSGTSWLKHTIVDGEFRAPSSISADDLDGDGDTDILGASWSAGDISWWENIDGTGTSWVEHSIGHDFNMPRSVFAIDINGDGDIDVIAAAQGNGDYDVPAPTQGSGVISWWENDGTGTTWEEYTVTDDADWILSIFADDIDNDGDADILGAVSGDRAAIWWENINGTGTLWEKHIVCEDHMGISSVVSVDINGDGQKDVLGAAHVANRITWWDIHNYYLSGSIESSILDLECLPDWGIVSWTSTEPQGTSTCLQLRSSDCSSTMGAWSDTVYSSGQDLHDFINDSTRYLQYRIILNSEDASYTPEVTEISFSYNKLMNIYSPNYLSVWRLSDTDFILAWQLFGPVWDLGGGSISIDLIRDGQIVKNLSGGLIRNTGKFVFERPVHYHWVDGGNYHIRITDDLGNYGSSSCFEICQQSALMEMQLVQHILTADLPSLRVFICEWLRRKCLF